MAHPVSQSMEVPPPPSGPEPLQGHFAKIAHKIAHKLFEI